MVNSNLTSRAGGNAIVNLSGILLPPTLRPSNPFPDGASTLLHPSLIRAKIVFETRGRVGRQFDKLAPAIVGIVYLHEQLCLAKLVDQPQRSAGRRGRSEAKGRSEEHTSELQSLMRISYAVFCLKKKKNKTNVNNTEDQYIRN